MTMRESINGDIIANEVRMRQLLFKGCHLLVEGEFDFRLYNSFLDHNTCRIITCNGKENVINCRTSLNNTSTPGVLAIIDADFHHITPTTICNDTILTDLHDLECMMLQGVALERLLNEFIVPKRFEAWLSKQKTGAIEHLLSICLDIGSLLYHSVQQKLNLTFSELDFTEFIDRRTMAFNILRFVRHIKNKSSRHDLRDEDLIEAIRIIREERFATWQLIRGHDFIETLSVALRTAWANWSALEVNRERLEQCLRLAYPIGEFMQSNVYRQTKSWENHNHPHIVFR